MKTFKASEAYLERARRTIPLGSPKSINKLSSILTKHITIIYIHFARYINQSR